MQMILHLVILQADSVITVTLSHATTNGWNVYESRSRLRLIDGSGNKYSEYTNCTIITNSLSMSPTQQPTYVSANVPWCGHELSPDLDQITIRWLPVNNSLNSQHDTYLDGCQCIQTGDAADTVKVASDYTTDSGLNFNDELIGAKLCDQITQVSTAVPTEYPFITPSTQPTYNPSLMATFASTYSYLSISSCDVVFQAGTVNNTTIAWVALTFDYPNTVDGSDIPHDLYVEGESSPQSLQLSSIPECDEYFLIKVNVSTSLDPYADNYPFTNCRKTSSAQSISPTGLSSSTPVKFPSSIPSSTSTALPSSSPTPSTAYILPNLTWCDVSFNSNTDKAFVYWELLDVDSNGIITFDESEDQYTNTGVGTIASDEFILRDTYTLQNVEIYVTYTNLMQGSDAFTVNTTISPTTYPTYYPTLSPTFQDVQVWFSTDKLAYYEELSGQHDNSRYLYFKQFQIDRAVGAVQEEEEQEAEPTGT